MVAGAIQWHLVAMFAPALFTGVLMNRLGASLTAVGGILMSAVAVWVAYTAHSAVQFTTVMVLCGAGWSFMHAAGTAQVMERAPAEHRVAVQGLANLAVAVASMISAFAAGPLLSAPGAALLAVAAGVRVCICARVGEEVKFQSTEVDIFRDLGSVSQPNLTYQSFTSDQTVSLG